MLRVALVGCGLISEMHVRGYAAFPERARIVACFDVDRAKAEERAHPLGARVATSYEALLDDPEIDAVELCTPPHLHPAQAVAAAQAGKHILCQKPLARTVEECDAMIEAARSAGIVLYYGEIYRTMDVGIAARAAIDAGRIGQVVGIQATYAHWQGGEYMGTAWRYDPRVAGGGQLLDGGIHSIDLMRLVGGNVRAASAFTNRIRPELGGEDSASVALQYEGGYVGTLLSTQAAGLWYPGPSFIAFGTEGILTMGGPYGSLALHANDLPDRKETLLDTRADAWTAMAEHYLDVVQRGAELRATAEEGREDLKVVLAAYRSAETGRSVPISEV